MEPKRAYAWQEIQALVPEISVERLREVMHELWIDRQVERTGYSGWRRLRSESPHRPERVTGDAQLVKPEDLFDHDAFEDFFKS